MWAGGQRTWAGPGQLRPRLGRLRKVATASSKHLVGFGQVRGKCHNLVGLDHSSLGSTKVGAKANKLKLGSTKFDKFGLGSANVGLFCIKSGFGQNQDGSAQFGAGSAQFDGSGRRHNLRWVQRQIDDGENLWGALGARPNLEPETRNGLNRGDGSSKEPSLLTHLPMSITHLEDHPRRRNYVLRPVPGPLGHLLNERAEP